MMVKLFYFFKFKFYDTMTFDILFYRQYFFRLYYNIILLVNIRGFFLNDKKNPINMT